MDYLVPDAELDYDGDGLTNWEEYQNITNPCDADTDGDQMDDKYEVEHGCLVPWVPDADFDPERDGLTNAHELIIGKDPCKFGPLFIQPELTGFNYNNPLQHTEMICRHDLQRDPNNPFPWIEAWDFEGQSQNYDLVIWIAMIKARDQEDRMWVEGQFHQKDGGQQGFGLLPPDWYSPVYNLMVNDGNTVVAFDFNSDFVPLRGESCSKRHQKPDFHLAIRDLTDFGTDPQNLQYGFRIKRYNPPDCATYDDQFNIDLVFKGSRTSGFLSNLDPWNSYSWNFDTGMPEASRNQKWLKERYPITAGTMTGEVQWPAHDVVDGGTIECSADHCPLAAFGHLYGHFNYPFPLSPRDGYNHYLGYFHSIVYPDLYSGGQDWALSFRQMQHEGPADDFSSRVTFTSERGIEYALPYSKHEPNKIFTVFTNSFRWRGYEIFSWNKRINALDSARGLAFDLVTHFRYPLSGYLPGQAQPFTNGKSGLQWAAVSGQIMDLTTGRVAANFEDWGVRDPATLVGYEETMKNGGPQLEVPAQPTKILVTKLGDHHQLSWNSVPGIAHYLIGRAIQPAGPYYLIGRATANATTFDDYVPDQSQNYYYSVKTINSTTVLNMILESEPATSMAWPNPRGTNDNYVAQAPSMMVDGQTVHAVWSEYYPATQKPVIFYSRYDIEDDWTTPTLISSTTVNSIRPRIDKGAKGSLHVVWISNAVDLVYTWFDGSWHAPSLKERGGNSKLITTLDLSVAGGSTIRIAWVESNQQLYYAEGSSSSNWPRKTVSNNASSVQNIALSTSDHKPQIAYNRADSSKAAVIYAYLSDPNTLDWNTIEVIGRGHTIHENSPLDMYIDQDSTVHLIFVLDDYLYYSKSKLSNGQITFTDPGQFPNVHAYDRHNSELSIPDAVITGDSYGMLHVAFAFKPLGGYFQIYATTFSEDYTNSSIIVYTVNTPNLTIPEPSHWTHLRNISLKGPSATQPQIGVTPDQTIYYLWVNPRDSQHQPLQLSWIDDFDGEGLTNHQEYFFLTNPFYRDTDRDGMSDREEINTGCDPLNPDTDGDGLPDGWEYANGTFRGISSPNLLIGDSLVDADSDGLTNLKEYRYHTDPNNSDTDGDGLSDYYEIYTSSTNPLQPDTDFDGLNDYQEISTGQNPNHGDTDGDGYVDGFCHDGIVCWQGLTCADQGHDFCHGFGDILNPPPCVSESCQP